MQERKNEKKSYLHGRWKNCPAPEGQPSTGDTTLDQEGEDLSDQIILPLGVSVASSVEQG